MMNTIPSAVKPMPAKKKSKQRRASSTSTLSETANDVQQGPPIPQRLLRPYRRLYERAALLHTLDPLRGRRKYYPFHDPDVENVELIRKFCNAVAYACDYRKGGDTIVAAALCQGPDAAVPVLVLAGNECISEPCLQALHSVFDDLKKYQQDRELRLQTEETILKKLVQAGQPRLWEYWKKVRKYLKTITSDRQLMETLGAESQTVLHNLEKAMYIREESKPTTEEYARTVSQCHYIIKNSQMATLRGDLEIRGDSGNDTAINIRHYVGRLGALFSYTKDLIRAAEHPENRYLFDDLIIKVLTPPPVDYNSPLGYAANLPDTLQDERNPPPLDLDCEKNIGHGIIGRIFSAVEAQHYRKQYDALCIKFRDIDYPGKLKANCQFKSGRRMHAEMQIVQYFSTPDPEDGRIPQFWRPEDRFIGCSKQSCYLCDLYVRSLEGEKFIFYATHQKLYLPWRPPDLSPTATENAIEERKRVIIQMTGFLKEDVKQQLNKLSAAKRYRPDSSIGVSNATGTLDTMSDANSLNPPSLSSFSQRSDVSARHRRGFPSFSTTASTSALTSHPIVEDDSEQEDPEPDTPPVAAMRKLAMSPGSTAMGLIAAISPNGTKMEYAMPPTPRKDAGQRLRQEVDEVGKRFEDDEEDQDGGGVKL